MKLNQQLDDEGVLTVTMEGDNLIPFTFESYAQMRDMFSEVSDEYHIRSIILTGSESTMTSTGEKRPAFCSGGDVNEIIGELLYNKTEREVMEFADLTCDLVRKIRDAVQPVIAAIDGQAVGAGAVLTAAADFRIATNRAKFGFVFTRVGLSGDDMGVARMLMDTIGRTHAADWLMTGRMIGAQEALDRNYLNQIVEPDQLMPTAQRLARNLARLPRRGLTDTKIGLDFTGRIDQALDRAAVAQGQLMGNKERNRDFSEFHAAFTAETRRAPKFEGASGPVEPFSWKPDKKV